MDIDSSNGEKSIQGKNIGGYYIVNEQDVEIDKIVGIARAWSGVQ